MYDRTGAPGEGRPRVHPGSLYRRVVPVPGRSRRDGAKEGIVDTFVIEGGRRLTIPRHLEAAAVGPPLARFAPVRN